MTTRRQAMALLTSAFFAGGANAKDLDQTSIAALEARMADYEAKIRAGDMAAIFDFLPPPFFDAIAAQAGVNADELREQTIALMDDVMKDIDVGEIEYSFGLESARYETSASGRAYAVMYSTIVLSGGNPVQSPVVALVDDGTWYLVRIDSPIEEDLQLLGEIYPDLTNLDIQR